MKQEKIKGIYLFNSQTDVGSFFEFCKKSLINFICTTGHFYLNKDFQNKVQNLGIKVCLNFPVYLDPDYLKKFPEHYSIDYPGKDCFGSK